MRNNMSSWDELLKAFDTNLIIDNDTIEYEYRVYYNQSGEIYQTTALKNDIILNNDYIVVTQDQHSNIHKYFVKNKTLVSKPIRLKQTYQLEPSNIGFTVVKNNPALIISDDEEYSNIEYYDYRKNQN